ncbi:2OG-Fe(II) oxygenase [Pendulispora rubella]|uniref:2OG-Fe(II) oxygenase n=1 Tax=Pendulispora rubella TaxID=2741070 RepID=A0ABZ2KWS6_9BACT
MSAGALLRLRPEVAFRFPSRDVVDAVVGGVSRRIDETAHRVAIEFASPRSWRDVYTELDVDGEDRDFEDLVLALVAKGILEEFSESDGPSISSILNRATFPKGHLSDGVGRAIAGGRAVVIPRAFDDAFAERVYDALEACAPWQPYEAAEPFFHYRHHNVYDTSRFPPALLECKRILGSSATKALMASLTGCDCSGPLQIGAAMYMAGDHSLPHTDAVGHRTVAYVWHLSKNWHPAWGGHFVWCPSGAMVNPGFNSLVIFKVSRDSVHFVSKVTARARGSRLAVNGWWQGADARWEVAKHESFTHPPIAPGRYGLATETMKRQDVVLL